MGGLEKTRLEQAPSVRFNLANSGRLKLYGLFCQFTNKFVIQRDLLV